MQRTIRTSLTPEQYVEQSYHRQARAPEICPNCHHAHVLEALGYYERYVSGLTAVLTILVRRFWCRHCRVSVSCLPEFAQPYRAVNTATIAAGLSGQTQARQVQHWGTAIAAYWRQFQGHLPALVRTVGNAFGPLPVQPTAGQFWTQLLAHCGDLAEATRQLVHDFHTCLFGTYRCHQPRALQAGGG
jgi:hypothetical protein